MSDCKDLQPIAVTVPGVNLGSYIQSVSRVAVLTADEERALAERLHFHDDLDAARQLVLAHLRFVVHIAKSYSGYGLPQADLIQEGNIGLMKAVKRFDPTMGVRLVSFAVHWIKAEIHEYVIKNWRIVKVATTKAQRKLFFNLRSMKQGFKDDADVATHRDTLTADQIDSMAKTLNVKREDVLEMVFTLRIDEALAQLRRAFPASEPHLGDFSVAEPSDYPDEAAVGYSAIHRDFIDPIETAQGLSLRITTAIANLFGAHG